MSETPNPKQALVLWCLLGRQGSALQSEIVPRIERADREALIGARFLESERQGRSLRLTVTDKGWNWAGAHLRAPLPANFRVLGDWLERIEGHLTATGATLADLIGTPPQPDPAGAPIPRKAAAGKPAKPRGAAKAAPRTARKAPTAEPAKPRGTAKPKPPTAARLRARIEQAYLALTQGRKAQAVRLSALRAELADLDRATVDAGLAAILRGDKTARLSQFTDPKALDAGERAAAYDPAGEPFHILWIQA